MNNRHCLLIGLTVIELGITVCRGQSTVCPNEPVTPLPAPKPTNIPNQPIPAYPAQTSSPPVSSYPTIPAHTACCPNQQMNPCPVPSINTACCNQCQSSNTYACPIMQKNSIQIYCCANQPVYPYSTNPFTQSCSPSCCQSSGSATSGCGCVVETTGCSSTTSYCCRSTNKCCDLQTCCQTELQSTTPTPPPPTLPPPPTIINCPPGTQLIRDECHLIYCPRGSLMINYRCIVIECPDGTVWTGHRCSVAEPVVHNLTFYNTVITQFNQTKPEIIQNNTNNIVINKSLTLHVETNNNRDCNNDYDNCYDTTSTTANPPSKLECCEVMTPRMCENRNSRWRCYSRRSRRCGEFCVAPIIYLRPPRVHATKQYVVMPPIQHDCQSYGNCGPVRGGYDCSGCAINHMEQCSYYCYRYSCPSRRCDFYDQERYCAHNAGSYGCQQEDGCFDNWCL